MCENIQIIHSFIAITTMETGILSHFQLVSITCPNIKYTVSNSTTFACCTPMTASIELLLQ